MLQERISRMKCQIVRTLYRQGQIEGLVPEKYLVIIDINKLYKIYNAFTNKNQ